MKHLLAQFTVLILLTACNSEQESETSHATRSEQEDVQSESGDSSDTTSFLDEEESGKDYTSKYTIVPPKDESVIELTDVRAAKPASWIWTPPRSAFSTANYILPAVESSEPALLAITEFDLEEGGNLEDNIARWNSQFRDFEGGPVRPVIENISVAGLKATQVSFRGEYMGAGAAWHKPDQTMIVVIFEQKNKRVFLKILGPTDTVEIHREPLYEMLHSIEPVSS